MLALIYTFTHKYTGEVLLLSKEANYLHSTTVTITSGSHPFIQLPPPALDSPATLFCSTCSRYQPNTLTSSDGRLLVLTDSYLQVFAVVEGEERSQFEWRQSLALDTTCSPLFIQPLSRGTDNFIVVCNTTSTIGYHIISISEGLFQLHSSSLQISDTDITDLIVGSFTEPFRQQESDALVYIKNGELTFATLFDGQAALPIFLDYDTDCHPTSVIGIYALPKPTQGKFRFILDCRQQASSAILRYKITMSLIEPEYPESVNLLPTALALGTPIASPDSEHFAIVQSTTVAVVRTEQTGTYRVHTFSSELRDVSFADFAAPTLVIVSPGQNHMILQVDPFLTDYNTSVVELAGSPAFCPNNSHCLPHGVLHTPNLVLTVTASTTPDGDARYFNLNIYDVLFPSTPVVRIENLAVQPNVVLPIIDISPSLPATSSTTLSLPHTTSAPTGTTIPPLSASQTSLIPTDYDSTTQLSVYFSTHSGTGGTRNLVFTTSSVSERFHKSSSSEITQTPTLSDKGTQFMPLRLTGVVTFVFCALVFVLLLVVVLSLLIITLRRRHRNSTLQNSHYTTTYHDEEKSVPTLLSDNDSRPPSSTSISATNPTTTASGAEKIEVNTVSVAETQDGPVSRPSSGQLVTLDLKGSARTLASSGGSSSGVSSAAGSPSASCRELHAEPDKY